MSASPLIVISTFPSAAAAAVAKGILDEEGIESIIRADNAGGMYPALAGAELVVRVEDGNRATEALNPAFTATLAPAWETGFYEAASRPDARTDVPGKFQSKWVIGVT